MWKQIKLSGSIIEEIEQQELIWYVHVSRMGEERLPKKELEWILPE